MSSGKGFPKLWIDRHVHVLGVLLVERVVLFEELEKRSQIELDMMGGVETWVDV